MLGGMVDFGGDSLKIVRFLFGNFVFCDGFTGESVPEKALNSLFIRANSLPAGYELFDFDWVILNKLREFHKYII